MPQKFAEDYLKSANCHVEVETLSTWRYNPHNPSVVEKVCDINLTVDFSYDPSSPIKHGGKWQWQIFTAISNELESFPHIGQMENSFWFDFCVDKEDKRDLYMKAKINNPNGPFSFYGIVAKVRFSDRKFVGDPSKAFVI